MGALIDALIGLFTRIRQPAYNKIQAALQLRGTQVVAAIFRCRVPNLRVIIFTLAVYRLQTRNNCINTHTIRQPVESQL